MSNQTQTPSPLDEEPVLGFIKELINEGETNASIVTSLWASKHRLQTSEKSIRRFRKRHGLEANMVRNARAGYKINGDDAEVISSATPHNPMDDPDAMLRERGLDPEEWILDSATVNEWDGPSQDGMRTYHQAKLNLKRKRPELQLVAPRSDGWVAPKPIPASTKRYPAYCRIGDQQAPYLRREPALSLLWLVRRE